MPQKEFFRVLSRLTNPLCDCLLSQCSLFHCSCFCVCFFLFCFSRAWKRHLLNNHSESQKRMSKLPSEAGRAESRKWGPSFTVAPSPLHSPLFLAHGGGAGWGASLLSGLTASHCHVLSSLIFQILSQLKRLPPVSFLISFFFIGV